MTGLGRKIKESLPHVKVCTFSVCLYFCITISVCLQVIGFDPVGSVLAMPEKLNKADTKFFHVIYSVCDELATQVNCLPQRVLFYRWRVLVMILCQQHWTTGW